MNNDVPHASDLRRHRLWTVWRRGQTMASDIEPTHRGMELLISYSGVVCFRRVYPDLPDAEQGAAEWRKQLLLDGWRDLGLQSDRTNLPIR